MHHLNLRPVSYKSKPVVSGMVQKVTAHASSSTPYSIEKSRRCNNHSCRSRLMPPFLIGPLLQNPVSKSYAFLKVKSLGKLQSQMVLIKLGSPYFPTVVTVELCDYDRAFRIISLCCFLLRCKKSTNPGIDRLPKPSSQLFFLTTRACLFVDLPVLLLVGRSTVSHLFA
jgi:hypothetical protein